MDPVYKTGSIYLQVVPMQNSRCTSRYEEGRLDGGVSIMESFTIDSL